MKTNGQVLDFISGLREEQRESLMATVRKHLVEDPRTALVKSVKEARKEFKSGQCRPASPAKIVRKVFA